MIKTLPCQIYKKGLSPVVRMDTFSISELCDVRTKPSIVVGIDLGTTNSCVAFYDPVGKRASVIPDKDGRRTMPSVCALAPNSSSSWLVGRVASNQSVTNPANTLAATKRLIGRRFNDESLKANLHNFTYTIVPDLNGDAAVEVNGRTYSPVFAAMLILQRLKQIAEEYLHSNVENAVITVPAYFNDSQRQATKLAGEKAGFNVLRIINEPTAAALAYGVHEGEDKTIAVYDLGGGTFDVSILKLHRGVFEVRASTGDTYLGGEDCDTILVESMLVHLPDRPAPDTFEGLALLQTLKQLAENTKIYLSFNQSTEVISPYLYNTPTGPRHLKFTLTQSDYDKMVDSIIKRTILPCQKAMLDANVRPDQIDEVILVGGMTRMPKVRRLVRDIFGRTPSTSVHPDEAVAIGATIQAGILSGNVNDVLLLDVTPLSLGIETMGGLMSKLINRNTTIPAKISQLFTTAVDNQQDIEIKVYQGERDLVKDNIFLGEFTLTGLPKRARLESRIEVTFDVDANGIVHVSAQDKISRRRREISVSSRVGQAQIDKMVGGSGEQDLLRSQLRAMIGEVKANWNQLEAASSANTAHLREIVDRIEQQLTAGDEDSAIDDAATLTSMKERLEQVLEELVTSQEPDQKQSPTSESNDGLNKS